MNYLITMLAIALFILLAMVVGVGLCKLMEAKK